MGMSAQNVMSAQIILYRAIFISMKNQTFALTVAQEWTVIQMAEYYIQDKTAELNKRIDDAFTELDTQRNRMSGLTKENTELKNELMRLQEVQKLKSLILRTILGSMSFLWIVQIIFNICISE